MERLGLGDAQHFHRDGGQNWQPLPTPALHSAAASSLHQLLPQPLSTWHCTPSTGSCLLALLPTAATSLTELFLLVLMLVPPHRQWEAGVWGGGGWALAACG